MFCKCTGRKGLDALRARRLPALLHLHLAGPERHGLHDRCQAYGFFGTIPATATTAAVSVRRHQGPAACLRRPADGPGPHRRRQLPQGALFGKEAGSMPDEEPEWSEMARPSTARAAAAEAPADAEAAKGLVDLTS